MKNADWEDVLKTLDMITRAFLMFHMLLLFLFFMNAARGMILVSMFTTAIIASGFYFAKREMFRYHTLTIYAAQLVEIVFAAFFVGYTAGLLIPILGITLYVFFCEYFARSNDYEYLPSTWVAGVSAVAFVVVLSLGFYSPGRAPLEDAMVTALHLVWDIPMFLFSAIGVYTLINQITFSERVLTDQAHTDKLTGLINRGGYEQIIKHSNLKTTTLIICDADKFKHVNDTYGHEVGDLVLKKIARTLKQNFRLRDCVCRTGGDEFVILMLDGDGLEQDLISRKINRINRELSHTDDKLPIVSVSAGIAYGGNERDWKSLFNHADQCMYQVKQAGGRGCRFYSP
ncbi:MAG: GGDEF domain-containing protein [Candidatus Limivicinus sp.]